MFVPPPLLVSGVALVNVLRFYPLPPVDVDDAFRVRVRTVRVSPLGKWCWLNNCFVIGWCCCCCLLICVVSPVLQTNE